MTVLPDWEIEEVALKERLIDPFSLPQVQPASYDVRLGGRLLVPSLSEKTDPIDLGNPDSIMGRTREASTEGFHLNPNRFVLGTTAEYIRVPNRMVARIEGKSSLARTGLQIHCAGYIDPGFRGNVTVEIVNFFDLPVILREGILIAQLSFEWLTSAPRIAYKGRYQDSDGVIGSRYHPEGKIRDLN